MWLDQLQLIQGMTLGNLWRVLHRRHFRVDTRCLGHLAYLGCVGLMNSLFRPVEIALHSSRIANSQIEHPPLFVLGIWRSGTTHLHNLLSLDENHTVPTAYQALYPEHFLITERVGSKILNLISPSTRPMDNMVFNSHVPFEDEVAVAALSTVSPYMKILYPVTDDQPYTKQDFSCLPPSAQDAWKESFLLFLKKLTLLDKRRIVLKSPPHLGRVSTLLHLFPDAQFVHIVRNPYIIFYSTRKWWYALGAHSCLENPDPDKVDDNILDWYLELFSLFERDRPLIPDGALHELKFEDLERRPLRELGALYEALALPGFERFKERVEVYLESVSEYKKNVYSLDKVTREKVSRAWGKAFDRYGYSV